MGNKELPTGADLGTASLRRAFDQSAPTCYLHVPPTMSDLGRDTLRYFAQDYHSRILLVEDDSLDDGDWFIRWSLTP